MGEIIPEHVEIDGLEGADGPITAVDVCTYGEFLVLANELLTQLMVISSPTQDDEKN